MECIYEFACVECGNHFDEFADREEAALPANRKRIVRKCPLCEGESKILPVQLVGHGQNHTSWSV